MSGVRRRSPNAALVAEVLAVASSSALPTMMASSGPAMSRDIRYSEYSGANSSMPRTDAEIVALGGTGGWDEAQSVLPLSEYRGEGTSFSYYTLNGESYVYGALDDGTVDVPDTDRDGNPFVGIDSEAFRDGDVSALILGPNVRFVGTRAFYGCESLTSAELGGGVRDIRDEAFRYCVSLGNVDLSGVRTIGFESFRDCRSFTSISIPDSVSILGGGAFYLCRSAVHIDLGSGFDEIPERAFGYCGALESIDLSGKIAIGDSAFIYCGSLTSLKLDPGTLSIGDSAFSWCLYLEDADLGESLRSVGSQAFSECRSLKSVAFPESLSSVGGRLFFHCNSLTDLYFKGEMPEITGDLLFGTSDVSIHIYSDCAESWGKYSDHLVIEERLSDKEGGSDANIFIAAGAIIAIAAFAAVLVLKRR